MPAGARAVSARSSLATRKNVENFNAILTGGVLRTETVRAPLNSLHGGVVGAGAGAADARPGKRWFRSL